MNIFDQMLARYEINTNDDYINAKHEVMQQIAMAGLYRGGFFNEAAFYGGTCLRIFYASKRFSEDMDFSLLAHDPKFMLENYFIPIQSEFKALGRDVIITKKTKKKNTNVESAFLKEDTSVYNLQFTTEKSIRIKIEVDTDPPTGFETEHKLLLLPFSIMVRCYSLPDLYAGKIHALLFRNWKNRVKGRDWYDFEWYVRNNTKLSLTHLNQRILQTGFIPSKELTIEQIRQMLKDKIRKTNIDMVKNDVKPFIKEPLEMEIWSQEYFIQLIDMIRI
jgi:predicted nucleotidyltransferase component of viral defense system